MERISLYECSQVPAGHPTGLRWQPTAAVGGPAWSTWSSSVGRRRSTAVEAVLQPYEAHHLPHADAVG